MLSEVIAQVAASIVYTEASTIVAVVEGGRNTVDNIVSNYNVSFSFHNGLGQELYITHRNGLVVHVPRQTRDHMKSPTAIFTMRYQYDRHNSRMESVNFDATNILNDSASPEDLCKLTLCDNNIHINGGGANLYRSAIVQVEVDRSKLLLLGHIYVPEVDVVVSTVYPDGILHPRSAKARMVQLNEDVAKLELGCPHAIEVVDPTYRYRTLWTKWLGQAIELTMIRHDERAPGIYYLKQAVDSLVVEHHSLEEIKDLRIFETFNEACEFSESEEAKRVHEAEMLNARKRIQEMEVTAKQTEMDLKEESTRIANRKKEMEVEHEAEMKRITEEAAQAKQQREEDAAVRKQQREDEAAVKKQQREEDLAQMRDEFERRQQNRKDSAEWLKVAGIFVGAISAIVTAFVTLNKQSRA